MKNNEKENNKLFEELKEVDAFSPTNFLKLKLLKMQNMTCAYSGRSIGISGLDRCEIDHIYPRSMGGNDALYNKVLCYKEENQAKAGRTPYEWLHSDEKTWFDYVQRLDSIKKNLGKKKYELLTSKPEDCVKLIDSYNALAETAQIVRLSQQMAAMIFGWGMQLDGENRHIYTNNGATTAAIRKTYQLNKLLGDDIKKNRANDKHHALDAICISFSRDYKYNKDIRADVIKGFTKDLVENALKDLMPYPYTNKKPLKGNLRPLETIYGMREIGGKTYITKRVSLLDIARKENSIKCIIDEVIKEDLSSKLELTDSEWINLLKNYVHPKKGTMVKKVLTIESEGTLEFDANGRARIGEFGDFGTKGVKHQFKHSKGHKGQILYYDKNNKIKVMPVFANKSPNEVREKLEQMGCKLYKKGMMFSAGCLLNIPKEFKIGDVVYPAGIYKNRTIKSDGRIKIETANGEETKEFSIAILTKANFKKLED